MKTKLLHALIFSIWMASPSMADPCVTEARALRKSYETETFRQTISYPGIGDAKALSPQELSKQSKALIAQSWKKRSELRSQFIDLKNPSRECADETALTARTLREYEDYLIAIAEHYKSIPNENVNSVFQGGSAALLLKPGKEGEIAPGGKLKLRSGDVVLSRGNAFTSATIARMGENPGQFSHMTLLYIDEQGQEFAIEAHIEIGAVVSPLKKYLSDGKSRIALFRHRDPILAHQAAKLMFERVSQRQKAGSNIPYDFKMDDSEESNLFCTEIIRWGYWYASNQTLRVPRFRSSVQHKNPELVDEIGITAKDGFLPADFELEPEFEMLAEWRRPERAHLITLNDAILSSIYAWMDDLGYSMKPTLTHEVLSTLGVVARKIPYIKGFLDEKMPENMSRSTLRVISVLNDLSRIIAQELLLRENRVLGEEGYFFNYREMRAQLEQIRIEDQKVYLRNISLNANDPDLINFHRFMRP